MTPTNLPVSAFGISAGRSSSPCQMTFFCRACKLPKSVYGRKLTPQGWRCKSCKPSADDAVTA